MLLPSISPVVSTFSSPLLSTVFSTPAAKTCGYMVVANVLYLARRAHLRQQSMKTMFGYRVEREPGVTVPMYLAFLLAWQCFVVIFPILEPLVRVCIKHCCFMYSYPNAQGVGFILEPLELQHLPLSNRAKRQVRLDWHRFSINVGAVGRNGWRHPPVKEIHRPHIDAPGWGIKHWPWRRRYVFSEK